MINKHKTILSVFIGVAVFLAESCQSDRVSKGSMAEGKTQDRVVKEVIFVLPTSIHILVLCHDRIHLMVKLQAHVHKLVNFKERTKLSAIW